ncbi:glycosyltransferase family 1 protein [Brevundimonas sp. NIBR11]|uniref:glycosyltransferase family 4 protein n=1 Tax=Brevundimonas sp. NIBR11 TaxID=3015999 RepID=UPI0022F001DC|nr:glycosyltransferase family 1 protein [Brevundimonas sp. NIBR11]WGM29882.1 D-inositol-3-phosphate glycosyltransferase [Brevundimonas sp. NIBR11]
MTVSAAPTKSHATLCIDGFNIALAKGSGIATYGRNLLSTIQRLGMNGQVLYGPAAKRSTSNVVNEAALVDADKPPTKLRKFERFRRTFMTRFGQTAWPITPSGEVVWPSRGGGRPEASAYWAVQDLFHVANRSFNAYGKETPVEFEVSGGVRKPDAMQWTATVPLYARGVPNIYTIHDLIPLRLPHTTMEDKATYMALCKMIARRADHIAVVSETTRQDVIRMLDVPEDRVTNTYQAVDLPEALTNRSQADVTIELEGVFNLGWKDYFLHFGAIEPKKNLGRIVEAYLASGLETPLVIVGGRAWLDEGETALLNQVMRDGGPSAQRIRRYEFMPFSLLISLIRGAKATLFPSLYEGFGLPVLESMALSTAVLTSTGGSLPEVAGDAAISVDPYDVQAMTRGLRALDADEALREDLVRRGLGQAAKFSVEAYQGRLSDMYGRLGLS